ncbi:deleted in malignant brain tumors 1 protein isoform X1 [Strongylocentrotus purpuratus]|uniref:SRCR domain-containing protein n=1 Tax=Strongylocentrotus purpuratus TaxID=7668 RepID=A0A7M7NZC2_STRPU|nr:deleted in malignant brain tumors 1 protein isoform X1 [Strongylocentrotus purpuratus]
MHVLWWGVQGMTTESPESIGARLVDGSRKSEGRVEVYYQGQWGSVCDNLWTIREASVLCKQLGYTGADEVVIAGHFGQGEGDVLLDMVQCTGDEVSLFECTHSAIRTTACEHSEDVGVVCTSTGSVRLGDVTSFGKGRLEYLDESQGWGTVCNQTWSQSDNTVACIRLGFDPLSVHDAFPASGGDDLPIVLGGLRCSQQHRLDECERDDDWTPDRCMHAQDVGVQCKPPVGIRWVSVDSNFAGIPSVYYGRTWGSFCLDNWDINAARIFCINSGFQDAVYIASTTGGPVIPPSTIVNTISCTGEEEYFTDCPQIEWAYQGECSQEARPFVVCQDGQKALNIVNPIPGYPEYGRVEVTVNKRWKGTICNSTWDQAAANVVCRDLGFNRGARRFLTIGGGGTLQIFDGVHCTGDEDSFSDCRSELVPESRSDCDHTQDAGVECFANDDSLIDFVSGAGSYEGVVYYRVEGRRALICDQTWTDKEAAVTCRMLGYEGGTATKVVDLEPEDSTDIFQWDIVCDGDEERLEDCTVTKGDTSTSCAPENVAQVRCGPNKDLDLRMTGSEFSEQGRVETYKNGEWVRFLVIPTPFVYNPIYDRLCKAMGYEEVLNYYNGVAQMPFQEGSQDTGYLCQLQPLDSSFQCSVWTDTTRRGSNYETGILCKPCDIVAYHPIRLVDINTNEINNQSGRVEIYHDGQWGNICADAGYSELVCSELGYTDTTDATSLDTQTVGEGTMTWFSTQILYTTCNTVFGCQHTAWGDPLSDCNPMAVRCVTRDLVVDPVVDPVTEPVVDTGGRASSLDGLALSLIIVLVVVTVDVGFVDV